MTSDQYVLLTPADQLAALQEAASNLPPAPRQRPMSTEQAEYLSACDAKAEARKDDREGGMSGRESDRRAGLDEDRLQAANDRFAEWDAAQIGWRL